MALCATVGAIPAGAATAPVGEVYVADVDSGTISQFGADAHGNLAALPVPSVAVAGAPDHVLVSPNGKYVYVLNCGAGAVDQFAVVMSGTGKGELTPMTVAAVPTVPCAEDRHTDTQRVLAETHSGKFVFALAQSLSGDVTLQEFAVGKGGALTPTATLPTGLHNPASLVITPNGKFVYLLDGTGNMTVFSVDKKGIPATVAPAHPFDTCPTDATITANGKTMYVVEQCNGTLSTLHLNSDGTLTLLGLNIHGCPREVTVTPNNKNVYVADACASPVIFQYRAFSDGVLTEQIPFSVPSATVLAMAPSVNGKALYVTIDNGMQNLDTYPIDIHGLLTAPAALSSTGLGSWGIAYRK
ncbi:MAG TPA: beta-propeller fold lactonase family protein [Jatrophihabitantaceae bacterium]